MKPVQFGGPLGSMFDPKTAVTVQPNCSGQAALPDDATDDKVQAAPAAILKAFAREFSLAVTLNGLQAAMGKTMEVKNTVTTALASELGAKVQIGSFDVTLNDEDRAKLQAVAAQQRQGAMQPPPAAPYGAPPGGPPAASGAAAMTPAGAASGKKRTGLFIGLGAFGLVLVGLVIMLILHFSHGGSHEHEHESQHEHEHPKGKH